MKKWFFTSFALLAVCFLTANVNANQCQEQRQDCCCYSTPKCAEFGSFFTKDEQAIAPTQAIPFDHESDQVHHSPGIEHIPGGTDFTIKKPGIYRVIYSVSLKCHGQVALTLNGVVVPGSETHVEEEEQLSTTALLIKICDIDCCGKILRVINNNPLPHGWHDNNIHLKAGKHHRNITAAIVIEKAADCCDCPKPCI